MTQDEQNPGRDEQVEAFANEVLAALQAIASNAERLRSQGGASTANVLANYNAVTDNRAFNAYSRVTEEVQISLAALIREPALVRVVAVDEDEKLGTYYICRETAHGVPGSPWKLAGRNTAIGRLATGKVGNEIDIRLPKGEQSYLILERAELAPSFKSQMWDAVGRKIHSQSYGPLNVDSLRAFLSAVGQAKDSDDPFEAELLQERLAEIVKDKTRRAFLTKMGLRDQPILDEFQDAVFRLPLNRRLLIIGPPGTGKTTTLIRRLGFMARPNEPEQEQDRQLIERAHFEGAVAHADSWLMFTPTDLLKDYLQEAFNRERIPAPDRNVSTWTNKRRELARNQFRILRASDGRGAFTQKDDEPFITAATLTDQIPWFEAFDLSQKAKFWGDLMSNADALAAHGDPEINRQIFVLGAAARKGHDGDDKDAMIDLVEASTRIRNRLEAVRDQTRELFEGAFRIEQRKDPSFAQQFAAFLDTLRQAEDDSDDVDDEDEDASATPQGRMQATQRAYVNNLRRQALGLYMKDRPRPASRAGQIAQWIADRRPDDAGLVETGKAVRLQRLLASFADPLRRYVNATPNRYRQFRREAASEGKWYVEDKINEREAGPAEIDLMLLASLSLPAALLEDRRVLNALNEPRWTIVASLRNQLRNQIAVDEATDFSPVQLALMGLLATRTIQSFFACGDFNQRITKWGAKGSDDMQWAFPDIDVRRISITYRHSQQLGHLASEIIRVCSGEVTAAASPENMDNTGYAPVFGTELASIDALGQWLAERIGEIEKLSRPLPTVAVLVNDERHVVPVADSLRNALQDYNLHVESCINGKHAGNDNDVRVFDVQHIKGLEFESVFFVNVDELAELKPDLFDKFLYVGATRAATFLGMTCSGRALPERIESLAPLFGKDWDIDTARTG
ncbi:ATP-binding domain-containing protein [Mesorhizobium sp. L-8-10]|uniref:ATP-binding domain-containing protein n=1 Tax=Mesorhizobium sp. L-8-10 TaxID=2744523 RepID=UPI001926CBFF|nr:ATP-binding domain-containing protein [Mesorhizobium sp. L-8-10]